MARAIRKHAGDFLAILVIAAVGLGAAAYILANQDARPRLPLIEDAPVTIEAELSNAQAVVPGQGQSVRVAGVQVGKIGGVRLEDGRAVVELELDPEHADRIRRDASALLRPRTGLKDMFIELDPGSMSAPRVEEGERIGVGNTAPDVDPDELLSALDADARAYLKLLVNGAGKGLRGRGDDLRATLRRFEPLHRDLARVNGALARRRDALARLVHNYGVLTDLLGRSDADLRRVVSASHDVFAALASQDENISLAVSRLPGALGRTAETMVKVERLGELLGPALEDLTPAVRQLDAANAELLPLARAGAPLLRGEVRPFVRAARPYIGQAVAPAARDLANATPDLTTSFGELNRFFNMAAFNPAGAGERGRADPAVGNDEPLRSPGRDEGYLYWLAWVVNNGVSLFSTSDAEGPLRRAIAMVDCQTLESLLGGLPVELGSLPSEVDQACEGSTPEGGGG